MTIEPKTTEIAERVATMRELCEFSTEEMAEFLGIGVEEYEEYETGTKDFSFTFLYKCAEKFQIDIIELMTGENPHLIGCSVIRNGKGLSIKRRLGFEYNHVAPVFKNKIAEPFIVTAPFRKEEQDADIPLSNHEGQEMDFIIEGKLKFVHNGKETILEEGDCAYYDSGLPHGMIAVSEGGCKFLAIVMKGGASR